METAYTNNCAPYTSARLDFVRTGELNNLFDLASLRRQLFEKKAASEREGWEAMRPLLLEASSQQRAELLFSHRLLASYGSSLPQIRFMLDSMPKEFWQEAASERRQQLANRLAGTEAGKHWMRCSRRADGWTYTARFLWGEMSRVTSEEIERFFGMLDEISILTDLLNGHGKDYGIDFPTDGNLNSVRLMQEWISNKVSNPQALVRAIKEQMAGKEKPKTIVAPIRAAIDAGVMTRPTYEAAAEAFGFGEKVSKSSFNDYTNPCNKPYEDAAFEDLKAYFKTFL